MADIHVEEFYKDAAVALVQLYSAFPRRVNLFVEDIAGPDALVQELRGPEDTAETHLPPSLQEDLSSHIHLVRVALKSRHSTRIGYAVQATLFANRQSH